MLTGSVGVRDKSEKKKKPKKTDKPESQKRELALVRSQNSLGSAVCRADCIDEPKTLQWRHCTSSRQLTQ